MADIARNSARTRAFVEKHYLPASWGITQNGNGTYAVIEDRETHERIYFAETWRELVAFALGLNTMRNALKEVFRTERRQKGSS